MATVYFGKFYMKSGNVIPFSATKLSYTFDSEGVTGLEYIFTRDCGHIVNVIIMRQIEAIVITHEEEIEDEG